jgi:hypothetical protein
MAPFPDDFYRYLQEHSHVGIKVGPDRETFLNIWMVEVAGRVFARSWNRSLSGWFGSLLQGQSGAVRYGDQTLAVVGRRPSPSSDLMSEIDQAYLKRFTRPENVPYAEGIARPAYYAYTVEILPAGD